MSTRHARCPAGLTGVLALAIGLIATPASAQTSLDATIRQYSATSIEGYLQPLADVLVSTLAGGYSNGAVLSKSGFKFAVELVGSLAQIDDGLKMYAADTPAGFQPSTFQTPTIFGGKASPVNHSGISGVSYRGSDGLVDGDYFPGGMPQVRLGGVLGTDVVIRYFSSSLVTALPEEDFPELKVFGFGIRHSVSQYFEGLPVDVSIGGSFSSLTFGDIVDLSGSSFGLQVGKGLGLLGLYGGLSSDGGTMDLSYTSTDPSAPGTVSVELEAKREMRFTGGAALNVGFLKLFGDATFGGVTTYTFGLRFGS